MESYLRARAPAPHVHAAAAARRFQRRGPLHLPAALCLADPAPHAPWRGRSRLRLAFDLSRLVGGGLVAGRDRRLARSRAVAAGGGRLVPRPLPAPPPPPRRRRRS